MSVGNICSREVDTVEPSESVQTAAQRMHARKVGALVVVDADGKPIGMVTDRDLAMRVVAVGCDPSQTMVSEVMTRHPATASVDQAIEDALRTMRSSQCRRIPVVDESNKLVGLLSLDDILELLSEEFQIIGRVIAEESPQSLGSTT